MIETFEQYWYIFAVIFGFFSRFLFDALDALYKRIDWNFVGRMISRKNEAALETEAAELEHDHHREESLLRHTITTNTETSKWVREKLYQKVEDAEKGLQALEDAFRELLGLSTRVYGQQDVLERKFDALVKRQDELMLTMLQLTERIDELSRRMIKNERVTDDDENLDS